MTTAQDIIQDSLERIGVYAAGETMSSADAQRALTVLNDMLDSWSNESLTCFAILEQNGTLNPGQNSYQIGNGASDFNMTRPIKILEGPGTAYLLDSNNNRYPVDVIPQAQWNMLWNIEAVNSNLPDTIFYDPQFPIGIINVYPQPNTSIQLYWDSYLQLSDFAELSTTVSLPPGYNRAIKACLALELGPYFKPDNWQPSALLVSSAAAAKADIKRTNIRLNFQTFEKVLTARGGAVYNPYSDTYR